MKHKYFIFLIFGITCFQSCKKDEPVQCDDEALDFYLLSYFAAESIYDMEPTGSHCLELKEALQTYLDEAAKYPASCDIDVSSEIDQLNALPCGPNSVYNDTFWMAWHCTINVPSNYKHNSQLDSFLADVQLYPDNFGQVSESFFKDNSFDNTTDRLQPGSSYRIELYELLQDVEVDDCVNFMKSEGGLLTSIQGLTLAMMKKTTCIASGNINVENRTLKFFSPDYSNTMPQDNQGTVGLPVVENRFVDDGFQIPYFTWDCFLYNFNDVRRKGQYLLVYFNE